MLGFSQLVSLALEEGGCICAETEFGNRILDTSTYLAAKDLEPVESLALEPRDKPLVCHFFAYVTTNPGETITIALCVGARGNREGALCALDWL